MMGGNSTVQFTSRVYSNNVGDRTLVSAGFTLPYLLQ